MITYHNNNILNHNSNILSKENEKKTTFFNI